MDVPRQTANRAGKVKACPMNVFEKKAATLLTLARAGRLEGKRIRNGPLLILVWRDF
jgi:hypothetical protein